MLVAAGAVTAAGAAGAPNMDAVDELVKPPPKLLAGAAVVAAGAAGCPNIVLCGAATLKMLALVDAAAAGAVAAPKLKPPVDGAGAEVAPNENPFVAGAVVAAPKIGSADVVAAVGAGVGAAG